MKEVIRSIINDHFQEKSFYVSDPKFVENLVWHWKKLLPGVQPFYAVKCNNDSFLLKTLAKNDVNFDCASKNEIIQIIKLGVDPSRILFAHTIKSADAILFAKDIGVNMMTFDSVIELDKIKMYHPEASLILRIRCDDPHALVKLEKYGANIEEVDEILEHAKNLNLNVKGVSFHVGSGSRNPDAYWKALKACRDVYDVATDKGFDITIVDIGGGMYADIEDDENISMCVADYILDGIRDFFSEKSIKFIAEPGRFFAEHYSIIACQIIGKRVRNGFYEYFINDGTYGAFSNVIFEKATPEPIPLKDVSEDDPRHISVIYGCTCDGVDVVTKQTSLPELFLDEWVYFEKWGAYTKVLHTSFNGFGDYDHYYI